MVPSESKSKAGVVLIAVAFLTLTSHFLQCQKARAVAEILNLNRKTKSRSSCSLHPIFIGNISSIDLPGGDTGDNALPVRGNHRALQAREVLFKFKSNTMCHGWEIYWYKLPLLHANLLTSKACLFLLFLLYNTITRRKCQSYLEKEKTNLTRHVALNQFLITTNSLLIKHN